MIQVRNLKKVFSYGEISTVALGGIDLDVNEGDFVAIMGPSGCGKTTLLNILGLLDNPTEVGFVFQSFNLIEELTVEQNVELPLKYMGVPADVRKTKVMDVLRQLNISHRAKHYPNQLSGGQQQRTAIARALVYGPRLILADEPTGNLDTRNGKEVMDLLAELNDEGTTIVMVTHSQRDASYAHRVVNMLDGFLVEKTQL